MIVQASIQGALRDAANNNVFNFVGSGAPSSTQGALIGGPGSTYTDVLTGNIYTQVGTLTTPKWALAEGFSTLQQTSGTITAAQIIATTTGNFGHANGVPLVAPQGTHVVVELVSVVMLYKFATAAYTAGGNITVNNAAGGAALTGLVSAANSVGNAASKAVVFVPLSTVGIPMVENGGLNLVSSAAFTNPGTAAGTISWVANFRVYNTGF